MHSKSIRHLSIAGLVLGTMAACGAPRGFSDSSQSANNGGASGANERSGASADGRTVQRGAHPASVMLGTFGEGGPSGTLVRTAGTPDAHNVILTARHVGQQDIAYFGDSQGIPKSSSKDARATLLNSLAAVQITSRLNTLETPCLNHNGHGRDTEDKQQVTLPDDVSLDAPDIELLLLDHAVLDVDAALISPTPPTPFPAKCTLVGTGDQGSTTMGKHSIDVTITQFTTAGWYLYQKDIRGGAAGDNDSGASLYCDGGGNAGGGSLLFGVVSTSDDARIKTTGSASYTRLVQQGPKDDKNRALYEKIESQIKAWNTDAAAVQKSACHAFANDCPAPAPRDAGAAAGAGDGCSAGDNN